MGRRKGRVRPHVFCKPCRGVYVPWLGSGWKGCGRWHRDGLRCCRCGWDMRGLSVSFGHVRLVEGQLVVLESLSPEAQEMLGVEWP